MTLLARVALGQSKSRPHSAVAAEPPVGGGNQLLEAATVGVVLDLEAVPWAVDVVDAGGAGNAVARSATLAMEERRGPRRALRRQGHPGDELALEIGETPLTAVGLDQAADGDIVPRGVERVEEEARSAIDGMEVAGVDEWQGEDVAGGADHDIETFL